MGPVLDPRVLQRRSSGEARRGVRHQQATEEVPARLRHCARHRERPVALNDGGEQVRPGPRLERGCARQQHVPEHAQRPQVAAQTVRRPIPVVPAAQDLRRNVVRGPAAPRQTVRRVDDPREPKVGHFDARQQVQALPEVDQGRGQGALHEDIAGLDVPVDHTVLVHVRHGGQNVVQELRHRLL